jgi:toxin-antitoxin system PIN domain toxin
MIAVDTNLLIYAHRADCEWHEKAVAVLAELAEGSALWAIPWPCVHEFLAIVTHPRIYIPPTPLEQALEALKVWMDAPGCRLIGEGPGYFEILRRLAAEHHVGGPMIQDARVAAICLHNGVSELWTLDRDFSRFAALKTRNPLSGS